MHISRIITGLALAAAVACAPFVLKQGAGIITMAEAESKLDIHAEGPDGLPILFWRIKQHDEATVAALLAAGADIEAKGYNSGTPILAAAMVNYWTMVDFLMKRGANIAVFDKRGFNLAYLTSQASPAKGSETDKALHEVRMALNARGLLEKVYTPAQVRDLMKAGKWPPK